MGAYEKAQTGDTCAICLGEFEMGDPTRVLPCGHVYHVDCIDSWLLGAKRTVGGTPEMASLAGFVSSSGDVEAQKKANGLRPCPLCKAFPIEAPPEVAQSGRLWGTRPFRARNPVSLGGNNVSGASRSASSPPPAGPAPAANRTAKAAASAPVFSRLDPASTAPAPSPAIPAAAAPAAAPWDQLVGWFSPGGTHHPDRTQAADQGPFA